MEEVKMKKCTKCGVEKPITIEYFHKSKNSIDGFIDICKECRNKHNKDLRKNKKLLNMSKEERANYNKIEQLENNCKDGYKICKKCGLELLANTDNFYREKTGKDGLQSQCKSCIGKQHDDYYLKKKMLYVSSDDEKNNLIKINKKYKMIKELKLECEEGFKICTSCLSKLPSTLEYFYRDQDGKDGLQSQCKQCFKDYVKEKNANRKVEYTVYAHINSLNNKIYIGVTKRKPEYRWANGEGYNDQSLFYRDIQKYGWDNFEHEVIASGLSEDEAYNFEELLIRKLNTTNSEIGYNRTYGGKSNIPIKESVEKMIKTKTGMNLGSEHPSAKQVFCDNKIFGCIKECADYYNIKRETMHSWLNGKRGMPENFYNMNLHIIGNEELIIKKQIGTSKKVICENKIFNSIKNCAEFYNIKAGNMRHWLSGYSNMPQKFKDMGLRYYIEKDNIN